MTILQLKCYCRKYLYTGLAPITNKWHIGAKADNKITYGVFLNSKVIGRFNTSTYMYIFIFFKKNHHNLHADLMKMYYIFLAPITQNLYNGAELKKSYNSAVLMHRIVKTYNVHEYICLPNKKKEYIC